ncbi:DNA/RNA helicase domain-containing protein [Saccharothrix sp. ST-888]|uniref:DNA/RNA helicase domain-containing protein n=1 Tax=Saccharothrix sp. ST-888 TaxID=1427391 RepID=UPI0012E00714|nr:DNA/RNA helicase domain-containing protein [Saccharothrix sp. ST-888]
MKRDLGSVEVLIEYTRPDMAGEADVILAGEHPVTGDLSYVVIELKQWRKAVVDPDNAVAVDAGFSKWKLHPVRQVQRYCEFLVHHLAPLHGQPDRIAGAALLHNARSEVDVLFDLQSSDHGRLFTVDRMDLFENFLATRLAAAKSGSRAADVFLAADQYEPPSSIEAFSRVGDPHPVFALQKEQELAFQEVYETVLRGHNGTGRKKVVIIQGGPGSGKTAIAVELLRTLKQEGRQVVHASGSRSFTKNLRAAAVDAAPRGKKGLADKQSRQDYRYFQQFGKLPENSLQVLICDEAHRVRLKSNGRDVPAWVKALDRPQADELILAAEVPVFLLDDWQSLRPDEVGSAEYLAQRARFLGCDPVVIPLSGMFRAAGSTEYREWVAQLLGLTVASPRTWKSDGRVDVRLAESPQELESFLEERIRNEGAHARITAGFCWEWEEPAEGEVRFEVQIGDWHRAWNAREGVKSPDMPETSQWATDPRGFGQIGCIYTAQNFEFDWAGVIIGPDLVWRDDRFVVNPSETHDSPLKAKSADPAVVDRRVRNAYHVLLTRGRQGTVVYSEDAETRDALRRLIPGTVADQPIRVRKIRRAKRPPTA